MLHVKRFHLWINIILKVTVDHIISCLYIYEIFCYILLLFCWFVEFQWQCSEIHVYVLCACLLSSMAPCHQPAAGWPRWLAAGEPVLHCCRQHQEAAACSLFRNVTFRIVYASIESLQSLRKYTKFLTPCSTKRNTHLHGTITQIIWKTHSKKWWHQVSLLM